MKNAEILQKQLRELREECNVPLPDFAEMLEINRNHLYRLETADNVFTTVTVFNKLSKIIYSILHKRIQLVFRFKDGSIWSLSEAAEHIREVRAWEQKSQQEYALSIGLSTDTIPRFERGKNKSLRTLSKIAEAHGATLEMETY